MNETAANASTYIACKGIYESKTDYNCRSTKLGENDAKHYLMMNVGIFFLLYIRAIIRHFLLTAFPYGADAAAFMQKTGTW